MILGFDGASEDGNVFLPQQCDFNPVALQCVGAKTSLCLSSAQVTALQMIQQGPKDSSGEILYTGWPLANMDGPSGMRAWMLGDAEGPESNVGGYSFSQGWRRTVGSTPPRLDFDAMEFDIDDRDFLMDSAPIFAATSIEYATFRKSGDKIIWWHGSANPAFSVLHFLNWFREFQEANGGAEAADDFSRLFLVGNAPLQRRQRAGQLRQSDTHRRLGRTWSGTD